MNPVLDLFSQLDAPITPAWLPHKSQCVSSDHGNSYSLTRHASPTIPGAPNYIPPMKPSYLPIDDWLSQVADLMALSAQGFIADIWTSILSRKDPAITRSLFMLWNEQIPRPNRLTSLFWLFMCETWPLVAAHGYMTRHASAITKLSPADLPPILHPPQPFMLPQSQHYSLSGSTPTGSARGPYHMPNRQDLSTIMNHSMTRHDREQMHQMHADRAPIYVPPSPNRVTLEDHIVSADGGRLLQEDFESGFIAQQDMHIVGGHGHSPLMESTWHLQAIAELRRKTMIKLSVIPGLPTVNSNISELPGGWIRSLSECTLIANADKQLQWGLNGEQVIVNGKLISSTIPNIIPRVWFGWTGIQRWLPQLEEFKPHFDWVEAYLEHRPFAIQCLFNPDKVELDSAIEEQRINRAGVLEKAKRFSQGRIETPNRIETAFKSLGGAFSR